MASKHLSAAEAKAHGDKALRAKNARIKAEQDLQSAKTSLEHARYAEVPHRV